MILIARPKEKRARTPTLPPTAAPNVAISCFLAIGSMVGLGEF
jgi:hypothetical protein